MPEAGEAIGEGACEFSDVVDVFEAIRGTIESIDDAMDCQEINYEVA